MSWGVTAGIYTAIYHVFGSFEFGVSVTMGEILFF
jgi:hypothetical protein